MITEGKARLERSDKAFFNPDMKLNRDITVSVINAFPNRASVCDALAGIGAKGIRIALETPCFQVILNDANPHAINAIEKNIALNKLDNVVVTQKDANILLSEHKYDKFNIIDIDPFGTPAPFIDSAIRALLPKDALLCVTATDTGALCGSFQNAAMRKYGLRLKKTSFYNELGVRALIAFCVREAAKHDIGLRPLFSHASQHYYRVFLKTERGKTAADNAMKMLKYIHYCYKCEKRSYTPFECHNVDALGPVWSGKIFDKKFVKKMKPVSAESANLIEFALAEAEFTLPYYDLHVLEKKHRKPMGKFDAVMQRLKKKKFKVARTHFTPHGLKTNAPLEKLL